MSLAKCVEQGMVYSYIGVKIRVSALILCLKNGKIAKRQKAKSSSYTKMSLVKVVRNASVLLPGKTRGEKFAFYPSTVTKTARKWRKKKSWS